MNNYGLSTVQARKRLVEKVLEMLHRRHSDEILLSNAWGQQPVATLMIVISAFVIVVLGEVQEGVILLGSAGMYVGLNRLQYRRRRTEVLERVQISLEGILNQQETDRNDHRTDRIILSPSPSFIAVYRDECWQRIPMNVLVTGDVIALVSGDRAPGDAELLFHARKLNVKRGQVVPKMAAMSCTIPKSLATFNPELLLNLCGDMKIFKMTDTPVVADVEQALSKMSKRPKPLVQKMMSNGYILAQYTGAIFVLCTFFISVIRRLGFGIVDIGFWDAILRAPLHVLLCFLPMSAPLTLLIGEAIATARSMALVEAILRDRDESKKKDIEFYDLDIEERAQLRLKSKSKPEFWRTMEYFITTLRYRLVPTIHAHRKIQKATSTGKFDGLEPIPYLSSRMLERLGAVTMLCCIDDDVLCESQKCVDEIFLLKDDLNATTVVLDVHRDLSSPTGLKFENPHWKQHLNSLKPIGLNLLVNNPSHTREHYERISKYLSRDDVEYKGNIANQIKYKLASHVRQLPPPQHLVNLSREIGFSVSDTDCFVKKQTINVVSPMLAHHEHNADIHAQGQDDVRFRGNLKSHLLCSVVLDRRSNGHQLLSRGHPALALEHCKQYWNGSYICPLSSSKRRDILDIYNQWMVEDLDCVALLYSPLSQQYSSMFTSNSNIALPPVYLVEDGSKPDMLKFSESSLVNDAVSSPVSSELELDDYEKSEFDSQDEDVEIPDGMRPDNSEDEKAEALWNLQKDQIFLGMVASGIQPKKGVSGLIEDVMAAGVRFVYFSPRNMKRSKTFAEKMGIETDWNCAISLRALDSDGPDPHRMTSNYSDWDVKARLPHGIESIRKHLDEVDNVPLLVSLFTDSTTETIGDMLSIFHENGEVVLCCGASLDERNVPLFTKADLAVAMEGNPSAFFNEKMPSITKVNLFNASDIALSRILNTLTCSMSITDFGKSTPDPTPLVDMIRIGRELLSNYRQLLLFNVAAQMFIACIIVLGQLTIIVHPVQLPGTALMGYFWCIIPALSVSLMATPSDKNIMTRTPPKNEDGHVEHFSRYLSYFLIRTVPSALICVVSYSSIFCYSLAFDQPMQISNAWHFYCSDISKFEVNAHTSQVAINRAEALTSFYIVVCLVSISFSMMYRSESVVVESPFRNRVWVLMTVATILFQFVFMQLHVWQLESSISKFWEFAKTGVPWYFWLLWFIWPLMALIVDEMVKVHDRNLLTRYFKFLRMQFDTRLGMWSPR